MLKLTYLSNQRRVEQLAARRAHNPEVAGSSPVPANGKISYERNNIDTWRNPNGLFGNISVSGMSYLSKRP